jgi:hypothetical protein
MEPEVVAAIITGSVSLILAVYNFLLAKRQDNRVTELEKLKSQLARQETAEEAKLHYEYEARKRLYNAFEPTLFQLLELAEYALDRIKNLTRPRVWSEFAPAELELKPDASRPAMASAKYEAVSTLYGLFAPLVVIRSMSRELTLVDLSLEKRIELQYFLASRIYGSFKDDFRLAAIDPMIRYDPFNPDWRELRESDPRTYWWQGLTMGRLETVLDLMTVAASSSGHERPMSFGEFERCYQQILQDGEEEERKTLAVAANPLTGFRPIERPVVWRMLIVQARLYQALLRTRAEDFQIPTTKSEWQALLLLDNPQEFEWEQQDPGIPALRETLRVTDEYLERFVYGSRLGVSAGRRVNP